MYQRFIENTRLRRFYVLILMILLLFFLHSFLTIVLLTFIFTLLISKLTNKIQKHLKISDFLLSITLYVIFVLLIYLIFSKYASILINQATQTYRSLVNFYQSSHAESNSLINTLTNYLAHHNWQDKLENGAGILFQEIQNVGKTVISLFLSFVLSFFLMIEKERVFGFSSSLLHSDYGWFFQDIYYYAKIFSETFGVVLEVQLIIAVVNTVITTIGLALIGFTQLPTLAIMIFLLSLVPVAGVILSFIPLTLIAYSIDGIQSVIYVFFLVLAVHGIESYVLNPKLMSSRTQLPIFFTFVVLLVSEHFFGIWGLVVGIPIFTFFIEIIHVPATKKSKIS